MEWRRDSAATGTLDVGTKNWSDFASTSAPRRKRDWVGCAARRNCGYALRRGGGSPREPGRDAHTRRITAWDDQRHHGARQFSGRTVGIHVSHSVHVAVPLDLHI